MLINKENNTIVPAIHKTSAQLYYSKKKRFTSTCFKCEQFLWWQFLWFHKIFVIFVIFVFFVILVISQNIC